MEDTDNIDFQLQLSYRKTILNAKVVTINGLNYCISKLSNLELCSSEKLWQKEGTNDFEATLEIYFVLSNEDIYSSGERIKVSGKVTKKDDNFNLDGFLLVTGNNHITNIQRYKLYEENEKKEVVNS